MAFQLPLDAVAWTFQLLFCLQFKACISPRASERIFLLLIPFIRKCDAINKTHRDLS